MTALPKDLYVEQGATWSFGFTYCAPAVDANGDPILDASGNLTPGTPYDLTGCFARMQIRQKKGTPVLVYATSDTDLNAGGGRIALGVDGRIDIELTDLDTQKLVIKKGVYDLELVWPLEAGAVRRRVDRLMQGAVTVSPNTTEDDPATAANEDEVPVP